MSPEILHVSSEYDLLDVLKQINLVGGKGVVAIDGNMGVGKSTLVGPALSFLTRSYLLHIDDFLMKNDADQFLIDEERLKGRILDLFKTSDLIIVEGILIRQILESVGVPETCVWVYIKLMNGDNWSEKEMLDTTLIAEYDIESSLKNGRNLDKQIYEYHEKYKPNENCDYVINLQEAVLRKVHLSK
jgi:hypothetical protein